MTAMVQLRLPVDVVHVGLARLVVMQAARQFGMDGERIQDLKVAVSEATTNAILSHRRAGNDDPVVLTFGQIDSGQFQVTVADMGSGFEPSSDARPTTSEHLLEAGLGVTVLRGLADEVEFVRGDGTAVHIRFALGLTADSG